MSPTTTSSQRLPRLSRRLRITLDADDMAAAGRELGGQIAGGAPDVEHARAVGHGAEHEPVGGGQPMGGHETGVRPAHGEPARESTRSRTVSRKRAVS